MPEEETARIIALIQFKTFTANTLTSPPALIEALERVRRRGFAVDDEEMEIGTRCIGAPIHGRDGQIRAAVSVSGPTVRITAQRAPAIAKQVIRCSEAISMSIGA
jgi:DNA-binding IclR family transcriptional regulator